jgi:hypothetical protein
MSATTELRETDEKGRVTLPRGFANSTLLIEQVSDVELVIRKAKVVPLAPGGEEQFLEERPFVLSPEDQRVFFEALMSPPNPNEALKKLMRGAVLPSATAPAPKSTKPAKRKKK